MFGVKSAQSSPFFVAPFANFQDVPVNCVNQLSLDISIGMLFLIEYER